MEIQVGYKSTQEVASRAWRSRLVLIPRIRRPKKVSRKFFGTHALHLDGKSAKKGPKKGSAGVQYEESVTASIG